MSDSHTMLIELEEILSLLSSLKDDTLDRFHENRPLAKRLLTDLSLLEKDTVKLLDEAYLLF